MNHQRERDREIGRQCDEYMRNRPAVLKAAADKPQDAQKPAPAEQKAKDS